MSVKQLHSDSEFATAIRGFKPVLVQFFATWCGPCKALAPHVETFAGKNSARVTVVKVDCDELKELAQGQGITSYPTLVVYCNGSEHGRTGGDLNEVEKLLASAAGKTGGRTLGGSGGSMSPAGPTGSGGGGSPPSTGSGGSGNPLVDQFIGLCPQATPSEAATYIEMAGGEVELAAAIFSSTNPDRSGPAPSGSGGSGGGGNSVTMSSKPSAKPSSKKPQEYFAGGGKNSGTAIIEPPKKNNRGDDDVDDDDVVGNIISKAKEQGQREGSGGNSGGHTGFQQDGRRLGHTEGPSRTVNTGVRKEKQIKIYFYKNGVVVEDGELRPIDDPATKAFLAKLKAGMVPPEIASQYPNTDISIGVADHHDEDYVQQFRAFGGSGNSLQSSAPPPAAGSSAAAELPMENGMAVDDSLPIAALALQLLDNTRMEVRVNPGVHTLNHVRSVAHMATPNTPPFDLWVRDMPPRPLRDLSLTIEEAKVGRCVIFMKKK